jgi:hypothetical protein
MAESESPSRMLRSIGAVLAGMVAGIVLSVGTDAVLHAIGFYPPIGQPVASGPLAVATIYRAVYSVVASYITARLAPDRPMLHSMVGGFIGFLVCIVGAAVTWNRGPAFGPHWYPVALIVLALPTAWLGGKIRLQQLR